MPPLSPGDCSNITHDLPHDPPACLAADSYSAKVADARAAAESCRVVFDLERLRGNIQAGLQGERVSHEDVHDWLEALGFAPCPDGSGWIGRRRTLRHFAEGEVLSSDALR